MAKRVDDTGKSNKGNVKAELKRKEKDLVSLLLVYVLCLVALDRACHCSPTLERERAQLLWFLKI